MLDGLGLCSINHDVVCVVVALFYATRWFQRGKRLVCDRCKLSQRLGIKAELEVTGWVAEHEVRRALIGKGRHDPAVNAHCCLEAKVQLFTKSLVHVKLLES